MPGIVKFLSFVPSKMKHIYLTIVLLGLALVSGAQKQWTLRECVDYALENNLQVRMQDLGVEIQEINVMQNRAAMLPNLNLNGSHTYNYGRTVDQFTNQFSADRVQSNNFYLSTQVVLFRGFQTQNALRQSRHELDASRYDVDKMKDDIALAVATAYLQVLYSLEYLEIAQSQLSLTSQQVERTRILVEAGTMAVGALYTIEAQLAGEATQLVDAQNQVDLNILTLMQIMDLKESQGFSIAIPSLQIDSTGFNFLSPDQIYRLSIDVQPGIKAAQTRVKSAETGVLLAKGNFMPSLSLSGSWGTGYSSASQEITGFQISGADTIGYTASFEPVLAPSYSYQYDVIPFVDQIRENDNKSIGLTLNVPIFNNFRSSASLQKAEIALQNTEYALQLEQNTLLKKIQQAYADAQAALKRYEAGKVSVKAYEESFKFTEEKFNLGMLTSLEYNQAKTQLAQAKSELLQSKYEYVFRTKVLDFYMGRPITL
jgi:outer membrane protein